MSTVKHGIKHTVARYTWPWPWLAAALVILLAPLLFDSSHAIALLSQMAVMAVFALSYNMLLGGAGLLSFGHAVYFGLGGFCAMHALRMMNAGTLALPLELLPLVGAAGGLVFGMVFGTFSVRRGGVVFAMITLGLLELVGSASLMFTDFFGGEAGLYGNRAETGTLTGVDFGSSLAVYYLIGAWTMLAVLLIYLLRQTPLGWMTNAVRDNAERAQFVGYNPTVVRYLQFCFSALFAGLAGGLFILIEEIVSAEAVGMAFSAQILIAAYIGGIGVFLGPVIGAVVVVYLESSLSHFTDASVLYLGLFFMTVVLFIPEGIGGALLHQWRAIQAGQWRRRLPGQLLGALYGGVFLGAAVCLIEMVFQARRGGVGELNPFGLELVIGAPWLCLAAVALGVIALLLFRGHALPRYRRGLAATNAGGE